MKPHPMTSRSHPAHAGLGGVRTLPASLFMAVAIAVGAQGLASTPALAQDTGDSAGVTSDDLYQRFKQSFEAAGGERDFPIGIGSLRGLIPHNGLRCRASFDIPVGTVAVDCKNVTEAADIYLVDNIPVDGDSALPETHDVLILVGTVDRASTSISADFGAGFFADNQADAVIAVATGGDPTAVDDLLGAGFPSAFQHRFWAEQGLSLAPSATLSFGLSKAQEDPRVQLGLVTADVLEGAELFFRETFDGNSRTCGSCHPASNNLVIDPEFVEELLSADRRNGRLDDPLFVAHRRFAGDRVEGLEVPFLLNRQALIRENVDGFEDADVKFAMRGVPHSLSMAATIMPPDPLVPGGTELPDGTTTDVFQQRTGWSGDGAPAPGTLNAFSIGAVIQHFRRQFEDTTPGPDNFRLPTTDELNDMEQFMLTSGRTADIDLSQLIFAEPEAEGGRPAFAVGGCGVCHGNAGANFRADGRNRNFDTQMERFDTPGRQLYLARTGLEIPCDGGFAGQTGNLDDFNFESLCGIGAEGIALLTGVNDAFGDGTFNTPTVIEAADTGPFFHNHSAETVEQAVAAYRTEAFNSSPGAANAGVNFSGLPDTAVVNISAFLRTINAGFNLRIAEQRCAAVAELLDAYGDDRDTKKIADALMILADAELEDAQQVLTRGTVRFDEFKAKLSPLNALVLSALKTLRSDVRGFARIRQAGKRQILAADCVAELRAARQSLTAPESPQALDFVVGEGNIVF